MKNKTIDTILKTLRKHSPDWIDRIRAYINRLEKQQLSKSIEIEEVEKIIAKINHNELDNKDNDMEQNYASTILDLFKQKLTKKK